MALYINSEGPFDCAVGFSQGVFSLSLVASLLDSGRKTAFDTAERCIQGMPYPKCFLKHDGTEGLRPQFRFVIMSGGKYDGREIYSAFYEPKIRTNILAFIGMYDSIIDEGKSLGQAMVYEGLARVIDHPGGHHLPQEKFYIDEIERFLSDIFENEVIVCQHLGSDSI